LMSAVLAFGVVGAAFAQEAAPAEDGGYIRIGGGVSFLNDWDQDFAYNPAQMFIVAPPTGQTIANSEGFLAGAALGFDYADGIRTELEYRYASTGIDSVTLDDPGGPVAGSPINDHIGAHFIMSNFYFDFYNDTALTPFIGGGVGGAFITNENGYRDAALAYQGRAGVAIAMGGGFSADIEYIYVRTQLMEFGPHLNDFTPTGPFEINISGERYRSSSVMLSFRKKL